ncbi:hypothetical protein V3H25_22550 [Vibrio parahaemolyticus]|uniref:hypothetical protein n=1 Tax=Vibrio parahaemolyticus TaxID=670 RepID=UPI003B67A98F
MFSMLTAPIKYSGLSSFIERLGASLALRASLLPAGLIRMTLKFSGCASGRNKV